MEELLKGRRVIYKRKAFIRKKNLKPLSQEKKITTIEYPSENEYAEARVISCTGKGKNCPKKG